MDSNNGIIDLTADYISRVREKIDSYIASAVTNTPNGALLIKNWLDEAVEKYDEFTLSNMLYQAEMNGLFDLDEPAMYEEEAAQDLIDKVVAYMAIDEFGFQWGVSPKKSTKVAADDFNPQPAKAPSITPMEAPKNVFTKSSEAKTVVEALEQNESISALGTALEDGADIELPFEKYRRTHKK